MSLVFKPHQDSIYINIQGNPHLSLYVTDKLMDLQSDWIWNWNTKPSHQSSDPRSPADSAIKAIDSFISLTSNLYEKKGDIKGDQ